MATFARPMARANRVAVSDSDALASLRLSLDKPVTWALFDADGVIIVTADLFRCCFIARIRGVEVLTVQ